MLNSDFKLSDNDVEWIFEKEIEPSIFIGYSETTSDSKITKFRNIEDNKFEIVTDVTPFYAESGGQIGDSGYIKNKNLIFKVTDTQKRDKDISHIGILENGEIFWGNGLGSLKANIGELCFNMIQVDVHLVILI